MLPFDQLIKPLTKEQVKTSIYNLMKAAGLPVTGNRNLANRATVRCERGSQRVLGGGEVEVADVELGSHGDRFVRTAA